MLKVVSAKSAFATAPALGLSRLLATSSYLSDNELADVIVENCNAADALDLDIFLNAIPDLQSRPVALDAAIEVTLQSMRRAGAEGHEAAESLATKHPALAQAIRTAHALGEAMIGTTAIAFKHTGREKIPLPFDVGPVQASGVPRYQLHQLLGIGSQGTVYLAQDRTLSEPGSPAWVAVKHVAPGSAAEEAIRARKVLHPNVVRALDKVSGPGGTWMLAFEFVQGGSLEKKWGGKTLPNRSRAAAAMAVQIAKGVQAAHSAGLIHRDLKPGNVLLSEDGTPKVSDFGISHHQSVQRSEDRSGSLGFMSPQQFRGDSSSVLDDVYGLGAVLVWMLTGACPNGATRQAATAFLTDESSNRDAALAQQLFGFDQDLTAICLRALAPQPDDRYTSADRMAMDLELWLAHEPLRWTAPSMRRRYRLAIRRSPVAWSVAGLGAVAAVLAVLVGGYLVGNAEVKRERAHTAMLSQQSSEQQQRIQNASILTGLMSKYLRMSSEDGAGANWLHILTFVESMMGSRVSFDPTDVKVLWENRVKVAEAVLADAKAKGKQDELEALMIESSLCLWLLRVQNGKEALEHLDAIEPKWKKMLKPEDEWFVYMSIFRKCGEVLVLDPNRSDAEVRRREIYLAAVEESKRLGEAGKPVTMLLERIRLIADPTGPSPDHP